eukprot:Seg5647.1 transcript_id=Seg5647.1/GoldUCD/mRNA.D3Y31 product="Zinc metalloproteinase nas-13" protein_id=Seg5647.1/GoldUCD/D3Y31
MKLKFVFVVLLVCFTFCGSSLGAGDKKGNDKDDKDCGLAKGMATEICGLTKEEEQKLKDRAKLEDEDGGAGSRYPEEENDGMFEGDINLTPDQKKAIEKQQRRMLEGTTDKRIVGTPPFAHPWPVGQKIPYEIDRGLGIEARTAIADALEYIERYTCVRFRRRRTENDYIHFYKGNGCNSRLGRIGGPQELSVGLGCETRGQVIHEVMHALSFGHEVSRPDRDRFVQIHLQNVEFGQRFNFKRWDVHYDLFGTNYDYNSVMHYTTRVFSSNGQKTLTVVGGLCRRLRYFFGSLGQRDGMSATDIYRVNQLFQCPGVRRIAVSRIAPVPFSKRFVKADAAASSDEGTRPEYTCKPYKSEG